MIDITSLGTGATLLFFLTRMGLFARKEDVQTLRTELANLRTEIATTYAAKLDLDKRFDTIERKFEVVDHKLDVLIKETRNGQ